MVNAIAILTGVLIIAPSLIWFERRLLALVQDRYGPNRVGPFGLGQVIADALKMFMKEDWIPPFADKAVFVIAPALAMFTTLISFALVPVAPGLVVFDSSVGLLIFLAISSLGSYSIVLAGWSSNNKYALLGALRGSAQMLSYEVFMALSLMGVVAITGSFRLTDIVEAQRSMWNVIPQCVAFVIFFIAALAETHRLPFDIPEAESELVAGFHAEYSGLKFGMFFVAEYIGITLMSAMMVLLFFGGWLGPWLPPALWFVIKTYILIALIIILRGSLPRPRYDQLLSFGWKYLLPLSLLNLVITAGVIALC
jgi:NADH-quinone oxidoreductase subunit H